MFDDVAFVDRCFVVLMFRRVDYGIRNSREINP